jgi:hypothetical protein
MVYGTNTGYGALFATFVPLGILVGGFEVLRRRERTSRILFICFIALLLLWWFALRREPRFGLVLWALSCIFSAVLLKRFVDSRSRLFACLFIVAVVSTCVITSSVPSLKILSRLRTHQYSRSSQYEYPAIIDRLPTGSRILNYSQSYSNNFALAGDRLTNIVIPFYALPVHPGGTLEVDPSVRGKQLSEWLIQSLKANYVVEQLDDPEALPPPPAPGLSLLSDAVFAPEGGRPSRWRIWRSVAPASALSYVTHANKRQ